MNNIRDRISSSLDILKKSKRWVSTNIDNKSIVSSITETEFELRKLYRASERKACLGFFGESQVGKSYLVGSLLSGGSGELLVSQHKDGKQSNFIKSMNPNRQAEATAVVTRFTIDEINSFSKDHFVVELLSPGELLRCIYEGFHLKRDDSEKLISDVATEQKFIDIISDNEGYQFSKDASSDFLANFYKLMVSLKSQKHPHDYEVAHKVYDILATKETYSLKTIQAAARVLWINFPANSFLFDSLTKRLVDWGEPSRAYVHISLLEKMLDASYLNEYRFDENTDSRLFVEAPAINSGDGQIVLNRTESGIDLSEIQILSKEVILNVVSEHSKLLQYVDGLDFPGVKPLGDKETHFDSKSSQDNQGKYLLEVIKIGKLKHLFTLHVENRDLTNLLLCIQEGEQNPTQISKLVQDFISQKGDTENYSAIHTLFTIMTKTDILFSLDADEDLANERWNTRFKNHFEEHFEVVSNLKQGDNYYRNVFLILNPKAPHYDSNKNLTPYQNAYMKNTYVSKYLYNKEQNWDALGSDDGGIQYLHERLLEVIGKKPAEKTDIVAEEFMIRVNKIKSNLKDLIPPQNDTEFIQKREEEARILLKTLHDFPGQFEVLLRSIPNWIPKFQINEIFNTAEADERRERRDVDIYKVFADKIVGEIEKEMPNSVRDLTNRLTAIDETSILRLTDRIIAKLRDDDSVRNYLERNRTSFRLDNNLSAVAFNQAITWLISGLIYNMWNSEERFANIDINEPMHNYFPSYAQYDIWADNLPHVYKMGRDENLPQDIDTLQTLLNTFDQLTEAI
jgi:hypothetical protein